MSFLTKDALNKPSLSGSFYYAGGGSAGYYFQSHPPTSMIKDSIR
jgi:hypothetical protein